VRLRLHDEFLQTTARYPYPFDPTKPYPYPIHIRENSRTSANIYPRIDIRAPLARWLILTILTQSLKYCFRDAD